MTRLPIVVIGGPRSVMLEGIRAITEEDCEIVVARGTIRGFLHAVQSRKPDAVIVDCSYGSWGLKSVMSGLCATALDFGVIVFADPAKVPHPLGEDAADGLRVEVLSTRASATDLQQAISRLLVEKRRALHTLDRPLDLDPGVICLTPRQEAVLKLMCAAESTKTIAQNLGISVRTVEFHKYKLMNRLQINTMTELVLWAMRNGHGIENNVAPVRESSPRALRASAGMVS